MNFYIGVTIKFNRSIWLLNHVIIKIDCLHLLIKKTNSFCVILECLIISVSAYSPEANKSYYRKLHFKNCLL